MKFVSERLTRERKSTLVEMLAIPWFMILLKFRY